jgi:nitroreductase
VVEPGGRCKIFAGVARWRPVSRQEIVLDVFEAIETRRSIGRVKPDPVSREDIEKILESAIHAPNHRLTEPWEFHVFVGKGRGEFARARAELARRLSEEEGEDEEMTAGRVSRERKEAFRSPVIIAVISKAGRDEIETLENYGACCAAVQNMQLVAHSLGLACMWRTEAPAYHEYMREFFGMGPEDVVAAYLYLGYPDMPNRPRRRTPVEEKTVWHGEVG